MHQDHEVHSELHVHEPSLPADKDTSSSDGKDLDGLAASIPRCRIERGGREGAPGFQQAEIPIPFMSSAFLISCAGRQGSVLSFRGGIDEASVRCREIVSLSLR